MSKSKIVQFNNSKSFKDLAEQKVAEGLFLDALSLLFRALDQEYTRSTLLDISDVYADMQLYDLSNDYLFRALEISKKEDYAEIYEQLAINYFYLSDMWHSGYYFHKKVELDGYIAEESVDKEILDYFNKESGEKKKIRVVYPPEKADFSTELEEGKKAFAKGDFDTAINLFSKIEKGSEQYQEGKTELSVCYFMSGMVDKGLELAHQLVKEFPENITVLCNYSGMLFSKKNIAKSIYYYEKALALTPATPEEYYKLATCSLEHERADLGVKFLDKVIEEKPYESTLLQLRGIGLINSGNYQKARQNFLTMCKIDGSNPINKFYAKFCQRLIDGEPSALDSLPLVYTSEIPKKDIERQTNYVKRLLKGDIQKAKKAVKTPLCQEYIDRVFWSSDFDLIKKCVYLLIVCNTEWSIHYVIEKLKSSDLLESIKEFAVYLLIMNGRKAKTTVIMDGFMAKFKPAKFPFEKLPEGSLFFEAYALAYSKLVFKDDVSKRLENLTRVLFDLHREKLKDYRSGEIASYLFYTMVKGEFLGEKQVCRLFNVSQETLKDIIGLVDGVNMKKKNKRNSEDD